MSALTAPPSDARPIAKSAQKRIQHVRYDPASTLRQARQLYFEANGFPLDGGYEAKWVDFELGPIPMPFPNSDARRRAVKVHDLHHVLTGYRTDIFGEAEISAWELAAGCGNMVAAYGLNLGGMALGMFISPRRTWRAWVRGCQSGMLYRTPVDDTLLERKLGDVRSELGLDKQPERASIGDALRFLAYWQVGAWTSLLSLPLMLPFLIGFAAFGALKKKS